MLPERIPLIDYTPLNTPTKGKFIFRAPQLSAGKPITRLTDWIISLNLKRLELKVDLSVVSCFGRIKVYFSPVHNIYTLPFRASVWLSCFILVLISTILLHLTSQTDSLATNSQKINQEKRFTDSVLSTIAAICQMDPSLQSSVTSSRIIMVGVFFSFTLFLPENPSCLFCVCLNRKKSTKRVEREARKAY